MCYVDVLMDMKPTGLASYPGSPRGANEKSKELLSSILANIHERAPTFVGIKHLFSAKILVWQPTIVYNVCNSIAFVLTMPYRFHLAQ